MNTPPPRGHQLLEHTADIAVELWADSLEHLFEQAALCTVEIVAQSTTVRSLSPQTSRTISLNADDTEELIVKWINEVLWLAIGEGFFVVNSVVSFSNHSLNATFYGVENRFDLVKTEIKSATYHDLVIHESNANYTARVILDV